MSFRPLSWLPVGILALAAGCASVDGPSSEQIDASVAAMTRSDVTRGPGAPQGPRPAILQGQGYSGALRGAIVENRQFAAAVRQYREATAGIAISQSDRRPQVTASATGGGVAGGDDDPTDVTFGGAVDVSLSQLIYDGGAVRANIDGAVVRAYAARANVAVAGNEVGRDAALAWIDLWQANAQLALLGERIGEVAPMIDRIDRLITSGIIDRAALAAAQRQFLDLKLEEERQQAALRNARERFDRYYRARPASVPAPQALFSDADLNRLSTRWPDAPAVIAAAAEVIATERAVDAARARLRPTVALRAGVRSLIEDTDEPNANVGLVLQYDFNDGGRRQARIRQLTEQLEAGRASFEDLKSGTRVEIETALSRHRSLRSTIAVLQEQIRELDIERKTLRSQITSGQADFRQLVESEVLFYRAQARLLEVRGELTTLEVTIASLTGQLIRKLDIDIDALL